LTYAAWDTSYRHSTPISDLLCRRRCPGFRSEAFLPGRSDLRRDQTRLRTSSDELSIADWPVFLKTRENWLVRFSGFLKTDW
jgi:hypothetical protein